MGGASSKTVFYENVNDETKAKILEDFKNAYSIKCISR